MLGKCPSISADDHVTYVKTDLALTIRFGTPEGFDGASGASGEGQAAGLGRSPERSESIPVGTPAAPEAWGFSVTTDT